MREKAALAWASLILLGSSIPGPALPAPVLPGLDLAVHLFEYGVFGWLLARSRWRAGRWFPAALAFAAFDEAHQAWIPGRVPAWSDLAADAAGLGLAGLRVMARGHLAGRSAGGRAAE